MKRSIVFSILLSAIGFGGVHPEVEAEDEPARIVALRDGATLHSCQTFHWSRGRNVDRRWIWVGSCPYCADIFYQDAGDSLSASVHLPGDARRIYVTLLSRVGGSWRWEQHDYQGPDGNLSPCEPAWADTVGFYHWAGAAARSLREGVARISGLGGRVARITLSPRHYIDYNLGTSCFEGVSLARLAQEDDVREALAEPNIQTFILTAYDGTTFGDCWTQLYMNPHFYTEDNLARLRQEYAEFALYLYRAYTGREVRFILSNWEGDNSVYCGAAFQYAHDAGFREWCHANYPVLYNGNTGPDESLEGLRLWFEARWLGVEEGRRQAVAEGLSGVEVYLAPEFSIVRALEENGYRSVLYDVVSRVRFDYVSYSAYESTNNADPATRLKEDLEIIRQVAGAPTVILGEVGYGRSTWGDAVVSLTDRVIQTAIESNVSYIIQWALYDHDPLVNFGLFDLNGDITPLGAYYREKLASNAQTSGS